MRLAPCLDGQCRCPQPLAQDLPAEQRTVGVLLVGAAAKQVGVELLELEYLAQVTRRQQRLVRCGHALKCSSHRLHGDPTESAEPLAGRLTQLTGNAPRLTPVRYYRPAIFATLRPQERSSTAGGGCMFSRLANLVKGFF